MGELSNLPIGQRLPSRESELLLAPVDNTANLAAIGGLLSIAGVMATINAEPARLRVVPYMAGLNNDKIFAMMSVWTVAIGGDNPTDLAMVERKGTEFRESSLPPVEILSITSRARYVAKSVIRLIRLQPA